MSRPALALALAPQLESGRVRVEAQFSNPVVIAEWPEDDGPRLVIDEATTTVELRFLSLEDLLLFQHNLTHVAIPCGNRR